MQTPKIADDVRRFVVIHVAAKAENYTELEDRKLTIERYMYGTFFYLGHKADETLSDTQRLFFLVEEHYSKAIIDRLASGLYWASEIAALDYE
jgi:hypothetical protein